MKKRNVLLHILQAKFQSRLFWNVLYSDNILSISDKSPNISRKFNEHDIWDKWNI